MAVGYGGLSLLERLVFMGYRSDVAIVLKNDDFLRLVASAKNDCREAYEMLAYAKLRQNDEYTTLLFNGVRWSEGYENVRFIENYINEHPHYLAMIGASYDDCEVRNNVGDDYNMHECVSIVRRLDIDDAGEEITFLNIMEEQIA